MLDHLCVTAASLTLTKGCNARNCRFGGVRVIPSRRAARAVSREHREAILSLGSRAKNPAAYPALPQKPLATTYSSDDPGRVARVRTISTLSNVRAKLAFISSNPSP